MLCIRDRSGKPVKLKTLKNKTQQSNQKEALAGFLILWLTKIA